MPSFPRRAKCDKCGVKRVDVRPNWKEKAGMPDNWDARPALVGPRGERNKTPRLQPGAILTDRLGQTNAWSRGVCATPIKGAGFTGGVNLKKNGSIEDATGVPAALVSSKLAIPGVPLVSR